MITPFSPEGWTLLRFARLAKANAWRSQDEAELDFSRATELVAFSANLRSHTQEENQHNTHDRNCLGPSLLCHDQPASVMSFLTAAIVVPAWFKSTGTLLIPISLL